MDSEIVIKFIVITIWFLFMFFLIKQTNRLFCRWEKMVNEIAESSLISYELHFPTLGLHKKNKKI